MKHAGYYNILVSISLCVCSWGCIGCQPDTSCRENLTTGVIGELYETIWDSITVQGIGATDTLYNNAKNVKKIVLPLRNTQDSTQFALLYHGQTDTLTILHTYTQAFVSVECGCTNEYEILSVRHTTHWTDTIEIAETAVHRHGSTNLYLKSKK